MDTSSLLEAWVRSYKPGNWPSFWKRLELLIDERRCVICEEVRTEIEDDAANLFSWVKKQSNLVANFDRDQELFVKQVMREHPQLVNLNKNKGWADPFVIALAKCRGCIVVTQEGPGTTEGPKIPYVCRQYGIPCINLVGMIEQENWIF